MRVLGIDPGTQIMGYGIVEKTGPRLVHIDNGGIFTRASDSFPQKLQTLFQGVQELIARYQPQVMAIENIFFAKNVRSSFQLGHARGVAMVVAAQAQLEVFEYTPLTVKQAVAGYGRAGKEQVQQMVKQLLKLPETTFFDSSDALAVAMCHLQSYSFHEHTQRALKGKS
ncbi:MAG: crossover junction endodeoxyribonuclease RuvC [Deltaproteobacteria bacterium]|nr:crossover junction endodeoxyribonuclease RuvC [Deltaproteobacteria bacterium]